MKIIIILMIVLLAQSAYAVTLGISPGTIESRQMVRGGYAENYFVVSTNSPDEILATAEVDESLVDWISFDPDVSEFSLSSQKPYRGKLMIQPPEDVENGNYSGLVTFAVDKLAAVEDGAGASIIAAVAMRLRIEVTDEEVVLCSAGAFSVSDAEIGFPLVISTTVTNKGNVRLRPTIKMDILNFDATETLLSRSFLSKGRILPTTTNRVEYEFNHSLGIGQYWAEIFLVECSASRTVTFDIVEKGGISDQGKFIGIRSNDYAYVGEVAPVIAAFQNTGPRRVDAQFKGEIRSLEDNKIVKILESEIIEVDRGQNIEFTMFFTPEFVGKYQISGRVYYNNKMTFNEQSKVISAVRIEKSNSAFMTIIFVFLYIIVFLILLILLNKIRKSKRKKF